MVSKFVRLAIVLGFLLPSACADDPYSAKRISMRRASFQQLNGDLQKREIDGYRRMEEAKKTLDKWWQRDCRDYNEIAPRIGDYIW